ncbi:Glycosyl hydrolase family 13 catalytic domain [Trinorchestia longiramus]|nr:Glycosyl hydrolase family 13 catalytic domain [Trinorchestia longiramus]
MSAHGTGVKRQRSFSLISSPNTSDDSSEATGKSARSSSKKQKVDWWKRSIIYQVYPRSFRDTTGNGIGDIKGIMSRLPYLASLGIGVVWLSPIFTSPMADFGYDISNFTDIDPIFGTMEDFDNLLREAHGIGLKLVMDLVPNHSSDEHEWFQKSVDSVDPYTDYYVWADPIGFNETTGDPLPPNNWLSVFGGSAWTYREERQQFYLHQFLDKQPDLNYRNLNVQIEMQNIIKFWADKGVDGFRIDAVKFLVEVEDLSINEPLSGDPSVQDPNEYEYLSHPYTTNQNETFDIIRQWRILLDQYSESKLLMAEATYTAEEIDIVMRYYGTEEEPIVDFPFNFNFIDNFHNRSDVTGYSLKYSVTEWLDNMPEGKWPNWVLGNHDQPRIASRIGKDLAEALNMMTLLLPGTAVTYYGEEIGMENTFVSYEDTQDTAACIWGPERYTEFSRDPERTPMQWDNSTNAGFTNGTTTWLPVNENYITLNVADQEAAEQSSIQNYKDLAVLRKADVFFSGGIAYPVITDEIFSYVRYIADSLTYLILINASEGEITANMHSNANFELADTATVIIRTSTDTRDATAPGKVINLEAVPLLPGEGMVLQVSGHIRCLDTSGDWTHQVSGHIRCLDTSGDWTHQVSGHISPTTDRVRLVATGYHSGRSSQIACIFLTSTPSTKMLAVTLAFALLPALATADTAFTSDLFSSCNAKWPSDKWSENEDNRQTIANNGAYTVAYRDARAIESGVTCPKLTLNSPGGNYVYTYKDASGADQSVTGNLSYDDGVFTLEDMPTGHFGTNCPFFGSKCSAKLRPTYGGPNGIHFMTYTNFLIFCTRNSYYLVPPGTSDSNCDAC